MESKVMHPIDPKGKYNRLVCYCDCCGRLVRNVKYCGQCGSRLDWSNLKSLEGSSEYSRMKEVGILLRYLALVKEIEIKCKKYTLSSFVELCELEDFVMMLKLENKWQKIVKYMKKVERDGSWYAQN